MSDRHTADTITDDALDALYARIATLEHVAAGNKRHVQLIVPDLERAQAALDRVRAAADKLADGTEVGFRAALAIREALADPDEDQHTGPLIPDVLMDAIHADETRQQQDAAALAALPTGPPITRRRQSGRTT